MDMGKRALLAASVAGLIAALGAAPASAEGEHAGAGGQAPCYGINKCKGTGDCGGKGIRLAFEDLLIGATALELGYSVATANVRHFRLVPGLSVVQF